MKKTENLEMKSGDSSEDMTYTNMSDLNVQRMRSAPRNKAAKNIRYWVIRILGVLLILGFLILVSLVSLLFVYYKGMREEMYHLKSNDSDLMSKVAEMESSVKSISSDKAIASLSSDIQRILGVLGRVAEEVQKMNNYTDPICSAGWTQYGLSCYNLSSDPKPWNASKKDCEDKKAHLVVINGEGEMNFLRRFSRFSYVWIGLSDADGTWRWVDGTSYDVTPKFWTDGQPDNWEDPDFGGAEDCVHIWNRHKWNDAHCSLRMQYICEKKIF